MSVCMFTGHRLQNLPFGFNENDKRCIALKKKLEILIREKIEKYGVVFARICLFLSFPGIALYPALHHSGGRVYESGYAFRSFRNDSPYPGQHICRTGIRLYCSLFRRSDSLAGSRSLSDSSLYLCLPEIERAQMSVDGRLKG